MAVARKYESRKSLGYLEEYQTRKEEVKMFVLRGKDVSVSDLSRNAVEPERLFNNKFTNAKSGREDPNVLRWSEFCLRFAGRKRRRIPAVMAAVGSGTGGSLLPAEQM